MSEHWICENCGTQYPAADEPPGSCAICVDDRQFVARGGQHWTTHAALAERLHVRIEDDAGLTGVGTVERFAIPQRALIVRAREATIMWDCISVVTPEAVEQLGRIDAIAISHPHFYSAMVEWSEALGGIPIHLHAADRDWLARTSDRVELWDGDRLELTPGVTLVHLPGHFPGSSALWWHGGARRALLTGDSLHVAADLRHVSVMHSVPNYVPVDAATIRDIAGRLDGIDFDDLYGFTWGLNIIGGARAAVDESLSRYLAAIGAPATDAA